MFSFSPVYWGVLFAVLTFGHMAETHSTPIKRNSGSVWNQPNKTVVFVLSTILVFIAGLRFGVGTDFWAYYNCRTLPWSEVFSALLAFREGGFAFLVKLVKTTNNNAQNLIFVCSLITVGLYCRTLYKYSIMYAFAMLLYLFMGEWQGGFNAVRQYVAASVLFAGHRFILERNLRKYLLLVLLASTFHKTAVVMLIPYFLLARKPDLSQLALLAIGAIILRFSYDILFDAIGELKGSELNIGGDEYLSNDINPLRILVAFIPVAIYVLQCPKQRHTKEQNFYVNACLFNSFAMLAASGSCYLGRIGCYTAAMTIIGYGHLLQMVENKNNRQTTIYLVMIIYLVYWLYSLHTVSNGSFQFNFQIGF